MCLGGWADPKAATTIILDFLVHRGTFDGYQYELWLGKDGIRLKGYPPNQTEFELWNLSLKPTAICYTSSQGTCASKMATLYQGFQAVYNNDLKRDLLVNSFIYRGSTKGEIYRLNNIVTASYSYSYVDKSDFIVKCIHLKTCEYVVYLNGNIIDYSQSEDGQDYYLDAVGI